MISIRDEPPNIHQAPEGRHADPGARLTQEKKRVCPPAGAYGKATLKLPITRLATATAKNFLTSSSPSILECADFDTGIAN